MRARIREARARRISRIARKLAKHWKRLRESKGGMCAKKPLTFREKRGKARAIIAYDFETTPIAAGNPRPLYLTAYAADWTASVAIRDNAQLLEYLQTRFLSVANNRARFVAWNANNFDVYFIAKALLLSGDYILRPYLTRSKNVRGLKVILRKELVGAALYGLKLHARHKPKSLEWEFLDGMAMTVGNAPMSLRKWVNVMAPEFQKLQGPDFDGGEVFNPKNPQHVAYAERDSEALYHSMMRAQAITMEHFRMPLQPTIGNLAIKIFQGHMPIGIQSWEPSVKVVEIIKDFVMRGGFCHIQRKYDGRIWKYDLNQAYAAAMRDAKLPAGRCNHLPGYSKFFACAIYRIKARHPRGTLIPFYYIDAERVQRYSDREITDTWITSLEWEQLRKEGWIIQTIEGYGWEDHFYMRDYVDKLERLRMAADDGPSGAQGTMMKSIGNNSYGKTIESLDAVEILVTNEPPEGYFHYNDQDDDKLPNIWAKFCEPQWRDYHQPQIGAFIPAHVRMVVRRAALLAPESFLYADTDCTVFDRDIPLPIDPKKYGFWKREESDAPYWLIAKKVYARQDGDWTSDKHVRKAKGLNVKKLTREDFERWANGSPPKQVQAQRTNFLEFTAGAPMYRRRERVGQTEKSLAKSRAFA